MINWQLSKQGIRWPVSHDRTAGSSVDPSRSSIFLKLSADNLLVSKWSQAHVYFCFKFISNMLCLCQYRPALLRFWFQTDFRRKNSALKYRRDDLFLPWARVGHAPRPIFMLWLVKIWQVSSCVRLMQHILKVVYFDSWSWQSFESTCDVLNCLFPLNVQNEIQLLSRVFCYPWLVCLLGFWLRNASLVKIGYSGFRMASFSFFTLLNA